LADGIGDGLDFRVLGGASRLRQQVEERRLDQD
jgi:hypothetical protein